MAKKNNKNTLLSAVYNNIHVSRSRKNDLKLKYYQGLLNENLLVLNAKYEKSLAIIEEDYIEEVKKHEEALVHENKNKENFEAKQAKYEEKIYWQRRKYKTKLKKQKKPDILLEDFDNEQHIKSEIYLSQLNEKYSLKPYSEAELNNKRKLIEKIKSKRDKKIARLEIKNTKRQARIKQKNIKIEQKIAKLSATIVILDKRINHYNYDLLSREKEKIASLNSLLKNSNLKEKQEAKLLNEIAYLRSKVKMVNDDNIQLMVTNLKMFFGGIKAVNDVSFEINKGEIFGLIGPNGAGKTTVFNCITQFYKATSGSILYRNKEGNIVNLNKLKPHNIIHEGIARSFQNVELVWELSVLDNLLVAAHSHLLTNYFDHMLHTPKFRQEEEILKQKAYKILSDLNILDYSYRYPLGLPYGILKKIELARTLMTNPSMIILDEPAAGLNDSETSELAGIIKKINKEYEVTIFLVEHDMSLVMAICNRILAISFGKELATGTPKEIQNSEAVRVAYLGEDD